jgi:hypothetical protein
LINDAFTGELIAKVGARVSLVRLNVEDSPEFPATLVVVAFNVKAPWASPVVLKRELKDPLVQSPATSDGAALPLTTSWTSRLFSEHDPVTRKLAESLALLIKPKWTGLKIVTEGTSRFFVME